MNFNQFFHLLKTGKIILFFDAFDEMADRIQWTITRSNFHEFKRAAVGKAKVILTCRTHYFRDRAEQVTVIGKGPNLSEVETDLYRDLRQQSNAEVVYLQEFDENNIKQYLKNVRGQRYQDDWKRIQRIYNLKDLAHRPLLLDMIIKTLPRLKANHKINAANLYNIFTRMWIDREEIDKARLLMDAETKSALAIELAFRMWHHETDRIHHNELLPILQTFARQKELNWTQQELEAYLREIQTS